MRENGKWNPLPSAWGQFYLKCWYDEVSSLTCIFFFYELMMPEFAGC